MALISHRRYVQFTSSPAISSSTFLLALDVSNHDIIQSSVS